MDGATPELDEEALLDKALRKRELEAEARREVRRNQLDNLGSVDASHAVLFLATSGVSGIVGNLAYDLLKKAVPRRLLRDKPPKPNDLLKDLALHAVREQCHRYDIQSPELEDMRVKWGYTKAGATAYVTCRRSALTARVVIPYEDRETRGVEVRIVDVSNR